MPPSSTARRWAALVSPPAPWRSTLTSVGVAGRRGVPGGRPGGALPGLRGPTRSRRPGACARRTSGRPGCELSGRRVGALPASPTPSLGAASDGRQRGRDLPIVPRPGERQSSRWATGGWRDVRSRAEMASELIAARSLPLSPARGDRGSACSTAPLTRSSRPRWPPTSWSPAPRSPSPATPLHLRRTETPNALPRRPGRARQGRCGWRAGSRAGGSSTTPGPPPARRPTTTRST